MPPPPLSSSTIVSFSPRRRGREQAADVVRERDVADQQHDRARAVRRPRRRRRRRCRRCRWRRGCTARAAGPGGPARTSRCRAPASRRRRTASPPRAAARRARPRRPARRAAVAEHAEDRLRGALVGAAPARQPVPLGCAVRCRGSARALASAQRARRVERERVREHGRRVLPGALGVERDLAHARQARRASRAAAWTPAGRRPAGPGRARPIAANAGVAQERVVVGDRGRAAARAGERVGQQRPAERRAANSAAASPERRSSRSSRPATITPRRDARDQLEQVASRPSPDAAAARRRTYGRPSGRPL